MNMSLSTFILCLVALPSFASEPLLDINAPLIQRTTSIENQQLKSAIFVNQKNVTTSESGEFSITISDLVENKEPRGVTADQVKEIDSHVGFGNGTDTLEIANQSKDLSLERKNTLTVNSTNALEYFDTVRTHTSEPRPGITRYQIRLNSIKKPSPLQNISISLFYETYENYPVVRKWFEISNSSPQWRVIENLVIDDIELDTKLLSMRTALTPAGRGAQSSIFSFSSSDQSMGLISASEIPSALRTMGIEGQNSYTDAYFEWVLGPAERFKSEPVFLYAWQGEIIKTISADSLPVDRAVEGRFKAFLAEHLRIGISDHSRTAPLWSTWSNFGHRINDHIVREMADIASRCGFKAISLDDGWQKGRLGTTPDPNLFPDFDATCDYIQSKGLNLGLWISTYRDSDSKDLAVLPNARSVPHLKRLDGYAMSFASSWKQFMVNDQLYLHDRYGAIYFKEDFTNAKLGDFALGHESRSRKESILRSLRGYLHTKQALRRLAPEVVTNCTHELYWGTPGVPCDLAVLKNAHLYHIPPNDYSGVGHAKKRYRQNLENANPDQIRSELIQGCWNARSRIYAHRGLPLQGIEYYGATTINYKGSLSTQIQDRQICSWLLGAPPCLRGRSGRPDRRKYHALQQTLQTPGSVAEVIQHLQPLPIQRRPCANRFRLALVGKTQQRQRSGCGRSR